MFQPTLLRPSSFTVTEVTQYLRTLLESDPLLQDVWIAGEVSNLSRPASGHIYFTLKDGGAAIKCVIWRSAPSAFPSFRWGLKLKLTALSLYTSVMAPTSYTSMP
jgi:exonuclease VII large subunit